MQFCGQSTSSSQLNQIEAEGLIKVKGLETDSSIILGVVIPEKIASKGSISFLNVIKLIQETFPHKVITIEATVIFCPKHEIYLSATQNREIDLRLNQGIVEVLANQVTDRVFKRKQSSFSVSISQGNGEIDGLLKDMDERISTLENLVIKLTDVLKPNISQNLLITNKKSSFFEATHEDMSEVDSYVEPSLQKTRSHIVSSKIKTIISEALTQTEIKDFESGSSAIIKPSTLDLAIVYSNPLVEQVSADKYYEVGEPVNFLGESKNIINSLPTDTQFRIQIECGTEDLFLKILKKKPKVLHMMCHGAYQNTKKNGEEYYLEFENENSSLLKLSADRIQKQLMDDTDLSDIKMVFINACHSEVGPTNLEYRKSFLQIWCQESGSYQIRA